MNTFKVASGQTSPLGATPVNGGVNFALYSSSAKRVQLCLFDRSGHTQVAQIPMRRGEGDVWHVFIGGAGSGQLYGFRVEGDFKPGVGLYHNPFKLLLDPYAKDLFGDFILSDRHKAKATEGGRCERDNAADMPKSRVVSLSPYLGKRPRIPWGDTVIMECHVKGATKRHPGVASHLRGKFLGLSSPAFISHLKRLGVNCLELMPVQQFISEPFLSNKGLTNYWGYNTLSFFTPHREYLVNGDIGEFQAMVATLHQHGIEVLLDVVFNHTAEGDQHSPTLNFRGIDNLAYYRTLSTAPGSYINDTGCGNTINIDHPRTLQLVTDSLRYWVEFFGVDGFRFDLASILARDANGFNSRHAFLQCLAQDPILSQVKLIAEPWDIGPGGYQLGAFGAPWREWNDQYRDIVRRFWRGDAATLGQLAKRLHGSHDIFEATRRGPLSSVNFVTSHDGFTLHDLVTYNDKHNGANGEDNRDGHSSNFSSNCGVEGETDEITVNTLRLQQQKNLLLTLLLSKGVPMLSSGSETGHSQGGNNNAYCQDNPTSWLAWESGDAEHPLTRFIADLLQLRRSHPVYAHPDYIHDDDTAFNLCWFNNDGDPMSQEDWHDEKRHTLGYVITARAPGLSLLVILHGHDKPCLFRLPPLPEDCVWQLQLTSINNYPASTPFAGLQEINLAAKSSWAFIRTAKEAEHE